MFYIFFFFFSSRRRHTRCSRDWSSDVCSSDLVEEGFQLIVGARHQTKSSSRPPRNPDSVPPQMGAVTFEVPEDQVDGLPPVGSGTALGAFSAERRCEALGGGLHIPELLDRGVLLFEPEGGPKPIKQI